MPAPLPNSKRYNAVAVYLKTGSHAVTAELLKIHENTLRNWKTSDWWKQYEYEIKKSGKIKLKGKLQKLADAAMEAVEDRLANGDWHVTPTGQLMRRPIRALEANRILQDSLHNAIEVEKLEHKEVEVQTQESINDRLTKLMEAFGKMGRKPKTMTLEVKDAVYEEWSPGLQTPERVIQLEAGSSEEAGREQQESSFDDYEGVS